MFGALMRNLWKADHHAVAPSTLRKVIGERNERFCGFQQHDAQVGAKEKTSWDFFFWDVK